MSEPAEHDAERLRKLTEDEPLPPDQIRKEPRVFVSPPPETEAEARAALAAIHGRELIDLAVLVRLVSKDVRQDLVDHIRVACAASTAGERRCVVEFQARGMRVHTAFMSLPKRSGR